MTKQSDTTASYTVRVDPDHQELSCQLRLAGPAAQGEVRLEIPTWVPGDYSFMQLARDLFPVTAVDTNTGEPLEVRRNGWQAFVLEGGSGDITVSWRAWGYEIDFGEPSGIVEGKYAILLGARYLHTPAHLGECEVCYELPDRWQGTIQHPSGAEQVGPNTWRYPSYELLLDTPVVMGDVDLVKREVRGTPFCFAFVDRGVGFDEEVNGWVDKVCATADGFFEMFGSFPFADYTFVLSLNPAAEWGLEHLSSSMCGLGPDVFTDPVQYATGVRVCAHELFHAWNVRRLRPAPLGELAEQLTSGSFTEGLWLAEGFTRYYEFLSCARAGVYSVDQFFSAVVGYLEHLVVLPAYQRISGADSSLSTYLTHSPKYPGRANTCIDYYDKGMLIGFSVDATLRLQTGDDSLDRAMRQLYQEYEGFGPGHPGYSTDQVIGFFRERLPALGVLLDATVRQPGGLDVDGLLTQLGFEVTRTPRYELGLMFLDDGAPTIYNVLDDRPAGASGIAPSDVITGVNGFGYTWAGLTWAAQRAEPVTLDVLRGHRLLRFTATPTARAVISQLTWRGDAAQAERLQRWLQVPIELQSGQEIPLGFYENFHGIETVI